METTLYDKTGVPVAYISEEYGNAVYLWDGHAVCYIEDEKIYGWKGKHIGWFSHGIIYDTNGYRVGFTKDICPSAAHAEPVKYVKRTQYIKYVKFDPFPMPAFTTDLLNIELKEFLEQDKI